MVQIMKKVLITAQAVLPTSPRIYTPFRSVQYQQSPFHFGPCKTKVHRTLCTPRTSCPSDTPSWARSHDCATAWEQVPATPCVQAVLRTCHALRGIAAQSWARSHFAALRKQACASDSMLT